MSARFKPGARASRRPIRVRGSELVRTSLRDSLHRRVDALAGLPVVGDMVQRQAREAFVVNRGRNVFCGVYSRWDEASEAASQFVRTGYDIGASVRPEGSDGPA